MRVRLVALAVAVVMVVGVFLTVSRMTPIEASPPGPKTGPITIGEILY